jgi:hypothetical protein
MFIPGFGHRTNHPFNTIIFGLTPVYRFLVHKPSNETSFRFFREDPAARFTMDVLRRIEEPVIA